ncbi:hypothetical protein Angca_001404, partial [Angiostrongylus cantonensis]
MECMSSGDGSTRRGEWKRNKRKRIEQPRTSNKAENPSGKAARSSCPIVFLCGFSEREKRHLRQCCREIEVKEMVAPSVTHVIAKPVLKKDKFYPYSVLYYAVVSGAYILQQSWLNCLKDGTAPECEHEFPPDGDDLYALKFREILVLYKKYRQLYGKEGCSIFSTGPFSRVFVFCSSRSHVGKQRKAALHSLIKAGGGSIAMDNCWKFIREKPNKAAKLVSMIIIANGEDLLVHDVSMSLIKQLLILRVPILYEEILFQVVKNEVVADLEVMMTHALYYWCNEHPRRLKLSDKEIEKIWRCQKQSDNGDTNMSPPTDHSTLSSGFGISSNEPERCSTKVFDNDDCFTNESSLLEDMEMEIETNNRKTELENVTRKDVQEQQFEFVIEEGQEERVCSRSNDDGPFEIIDLDGDQKFDVEISVGRSWSDGMSALSHLVPKALACSGVESASLPEDLRQYFSLIIAELPHNLPTSFIHDFICFEAVNSIRNSLHPLLLPSPEILSLMFHDIAKPEFGQQFDTGSAVYRLLMFFLYKFPPCNAEGRFYWLQVLTSEPSTYDASACNKRGGFYMKGSSLLRRVADFRQMILEIFTEDGKNHNLMELLVSILEVDLFNLEGCDGLNSSQEIIDDVDEPNRSSHSLSSDEMTTLLKQSQNSSILDGVPLSVLVFYDPIERRKRGLDKAAMETCFAIINTALATESIISASLCWRLLAVTLEGLLFFLSEKIKLFRREQISVDLQLDIERLGRYLLKKGLSLIEIRRFLRV